MRDVNTLLLGLLSLALLAACSDTGRGNGDGDGGPGADSSMDGSSGGDSSVPSDGDTIDPFAPDAACGSSAVETQQIPGKLLLVFDRSGSMDNAPGEMGGTSKWDQATSAINSVMSSVSDELSVGLMLFPSPGGDCDVDPTPQVPVAPLSTSRSQIMSELSSANASGGVTPIIDATRKGWAHLDTLDARGQRGLIVVTDGAENCDDDMKDTFLMEASTNEDRGYLTYVVGLANANNFLSQLAVNGGTRRTPDCKPMCTSDTCYDSSDCGGLNCFGSTSIGGFDVPGKCGCDTDGDCVEPQTCMSDPFGLLGNFCGGDANCCHYNARASDFSTEFEDALDDIARRFLDSCVFEVPKDDPDMFDPNLVNVGVTFEGEERMVLPRSDDPSVDSWDYTDDSHDSLVIQGDICEELRMSSATVEIVVGCPTILI